MIIDRDYLSCVVNYLSQCWQLQRWQFFFSFWILLCFLRQLLYIFRQFFHDDFSHLFMSNFSSFTSRLHTSRLPNLRLAETIQISQGFFRLLFVLSQSALTKHSEHSPNINNTTVFGVLLVKYIPSSFLSERIWNMFNLDSWAAYVVQDSLHYKCVLKPQALCTDTLVLIVSWDVFHGGQE